MEIIPALLIILFFLFLSFMFAGLETGIISINRLKLEKLARTSRRHEHLLKFIEHPDKFLGTTLIGNNIANVIFASVSTYWAQTIVNKHTSVNFDARWISLIAGGVVLVFGEIVPKILFRDHADKLVPTLYPFLRFFYGIYRPFVAAVTWINRKLQKLLKIESNHSMMYITRDDLAFLLSQTATDPGLEPHIDMIEDALEFNEQKARNVMIPRTDVIAIPVDMTIPEVLELARSEGFTRYPVYRETLDNIIGVLILYDIIRKKGSEGMTAGQLVHEPFFVPEITDLDELLKAMQKHHKSMAIVVDSFGGTAGIVTIEDILEEIIGEIADEFDTEEDNETDVEQVGPNTWIVAADVEIDSLNDEYEMTLPTGDYETVAGLILDKLERIPHHGQIVHLDDYRIQILQSTDKKIIKVKIHAYDNSEENQIKET